MMVFYVGATGVALLCFIVGFFLGKSNLKSKIEKALEEGHGALDAREFTMRQQLEDAMAEAARLRPLAQEYSRVQDRLRAEQSQYDQMKAEFDASLKGSAGGESRKSAATSDQPRTAPAPVSADEAVQKLMKSLELTFKESGEQPQASSEPSSVIEQPPMVKEEPPTPQVQPEAIIELPSAPPVQPKPIIAVQPKIEPKIPQPSAPTAPVEDEWQEFARSLADLTRRNQ